MDIKDWINVALALIMVIYICLIIWIMFRVRVKESREFDSFRTAMTRGIETKKVCNLTDCMDLVKGITTNLEDERTRAKLATWLPRYFLAVVSDRVGFTQPMKSSDAKDLVSSLIRALEKSDPYASLPSAERGILNDIGRSIDIGNRELLHEKTKDLAGLVEARVEYQDRIERRNKYAVPLAAVGVILTCLFGVMSFIK